jgi:uncharacterized protein YbcI
MLVRQVAMRTKREIESAICEEINRFEQDYMGRRPNDVRAHLIDDVVVVRVQDVLTVAEQDLIKMLPPAQGRDLFKEVRKHLIETARLRLVAAIMEVTGANVVSVHHDISTVTGEEVLLFTLDESPPVRVTNAAS